jgi:uncharacterized membrane protein YoaK (UPF0700 family)
MKLPLPVLLSLNAGYLDTAGFLALRGLFTAHVTGNFVTFGAAIVQGGSGAVAKLVALPVFCAVVVATRVIGHRLEARKVDVLRAMLCVEVVLLAIGAVLAIALGPFTDGDAWGALVTGMCFVAGMAIQNAVHRVHFPTAPPTTLMTGTTTQIMIDLADRIHGWSPEQAPVVRARLARMSAAVGAFAVGCAAAAVMVHVVGGWCFVVAPLLAALSPFATVPAAGAKPR